MRDSLSESRRVARLGAVGFRGWLGGRVCTSLGPSSLENNPRWKPGAHEREREGGVECGARDFAVSTGNGSMPRWGMARVRAALLPALSEPLPDDSDRDLGLVLIDRQIGGFDWVEVLDWAGILDRSDTNPPICRCCDSDLAAQDSKADDGLDFGKMCLGLKAFPAGRCGFWPHRRVLSFAQKKNRRGGIPQKVFGQLGLLVNERGPGRPFGRPTTSRLVLTEPRTKKALAQQRRSLCQATRQKQAFSFPI